MHKAGKEEESGGVPSLSGVWQVEERIERGEHRSRSSSNELKMRLRDWLLLIPDYDGCPYRLERFVDSVRYVNSQLSSKYERALLLALGRKLTNKAYDSFEHKLHGYGCIEDFLKSLQGRFGDVGSENSLLDQLYHARQFSDESVDRYGTRLDKLAARICNIYEEDDDASKKLVRDIAMVSFRRGLKNSEIELRVGSCEPKSFEDAIRMAIVVENEIRSRDKLMRRSSYYYSCKEKYRSR